MSVNQNTVRAQVRRAVRSGVLVRQPCEVCGERKVDAHHRWGYDDPLRVAWLCHRHHTHEHIGKVERNEAIVARLSTDRPPTHHALAVEYGLSHQRVSAIARRAKVTSPYRHRRARR